MTDPSIQSAGYSEMAEKWRLPRALMGGTALMRQHGTEFLPRHPAENENVYRERAQRTVLRNYFRKTVLKIVGRLFSSAPLISEETPQYLQDMLKNVDLTGRGLGNFARDWFADALVHGLSYAYVDYPKQQNAKSSGRPYAIHIPADQLIAAQWENSASGMRLNQIRVRENSCEISGFEETSEDRIRVIYPDYWQVYRKSKRAGWSICEEGENSLGHIPLVTLYTNRTGYMQASPLLEDLAYLNLEHYQIRSDQRNALNVASFPILAASGYDPEIDGPIEVGPNKVLTTSDTDGKYYYVESTGAALEAGARELADLEKAIAQFGMQFEPGGHGESATGRALDAAEALSPLNNLREELEEALNSLMAEFARWLGEPVSGSIKVPRNTDTALKENDFSKVLGLYQAGAIDAETITDEARQRGILNDNVNFNEAVNTL